MPHATPSQPRRAQNGKRPSGAASDRLPLSQPKLEFLPLDDAKPNPRTPRQHDPQQILAIARNVDASGFTAPILIDRDSTIIAGHGRLEAAKLLGLSVIPLIRLERLTKAQAGAYQIADGRLTEWSALDDINLETK